jgi:hypothetical protein
VPQSTKLTAEQLSALLDAVNDARDQLAIERATANDAACSRARQRFLAALSSYADGLAANGAPLPHRLRVELNLYRGLHQGR